MSTNPSFVLKAVGAPKSLCRDLFSISPEQTVFEEVNALSAQKEQSKRSQRPIPEIAGDQVLIQVKKTGE
uniref:Uncharacterized protein n=1 Tax=Mycena chlorophos TaxID=658473 RepID=A0ABQ0M9G9_MYCCL|nr:predicted protein [Mycena chlorophos]